MSRINKDMHTPVLVNQAIEQLEVRKNGLYIDATAGEGGHLYEILKRGGRVLALDWDKNQIEALRNKFNGSTVKFHQGNFANIETIAKEEEFFPVDGILFDLGLSMRQLAESGKGFSFKNDAEPLDMRIGEETEFAANELLNMLNEHELYSIFARNSEEIDSQLIARQVVIDRIKHKYQTVGDLKVTISSAIKNCPQRHMHNLEKTNARIFQALRIAVNDEFTNIRKGLTGASNIINKTGKIVVITFHSLEDRIVKNFVRENNLKQVDKKAVKGDKRKAFERSAKLRVIQI